MNPIHNPMEPQNLRIRLNFKNGVLSKSQKKDGLTNSWFLLKPHHLHHTFYDVVSCIRNSFQLDHTCPNGIILSMEGFVLPEFESTSILKDKDLISVKKKETRLIYANKVIEEVETYIEDEIVEKQPIPPRLRLLANEEFNEEGGGYQSESDENKDEVDKSTSPVRNPCNGHVVSKKRKASTKIENSKKKRKREAVVSTAQKKHLHNCEQITIIQKKRKHENGMNENAMPFPVSTKKCTDDLEPTSNYESKLDENQEDTKRASGVPDKVKKVSRSTRRKKSQRAIKRLHRDKAKLDERDKQQTVKNITTEAGLKKDKEANITQQSDEDDDAEGDLVPVMIRPGLIRFTPSGKVKDVQEANTLNVQSTQNGTWKEHSTQKDVPDNKQKQVAKEACWNGIMNKRKGQKWGQENQSTSSWKDTRDINEQSSGTWATRNQPSSSWQQSGDFNGQSSSSWADKNYPPKKKPINFDKLLPLIDLPKAGDIIAYRLLELSSSWCPELSSFRVGKITSFEPDSNKIILVPVPDYPLNLEKKAYEGNDADDQPLRSSVYNEDGSLETDFPSLNDIRIVKLSDLTQSVCAKTPITNGSSVPPKSKTDDEAKDGPAIGKKDVWEEMSEAVAAKKAQLMQEDRWNKKVTPARRPWSYRSMRSNATGPIIARLRGQNGA